MSVLISSNPVKCLNYGTFRSVLLIIVPGANIMRRRILVHTRSDVPSNVQVSHDTRSGQEEVLHFITAHK